MRVIEFHYYCDNGKAAKHPPQTVVADTVLVWSPDKDHVVELDLCDDCLNALNLPTLSALADAMGRPITQPGEDPSLVCPLGCNGGKPFKNLGGRNHHMTRKHPDWVAPEQ